MMMWFCEELRPRTCVSLGTATETDTALVFSRFTLMHGLNYRDTTALISRASDVKLGLGLDFGDSQLSSSPLCPVSMLS